jgi:enterochelin esterase-like enzyme
MSAVSGPVVTAPHDRPPGAVAVPPHTPRPYPLPVVEHPRPASLTVDAGTPVIERDGDDHLVTFLWQGVAQDVILHVNKLTDYNDLRQSRMRRLPGTDLWHLTYRMPGTWRASYAIGPLDAPVRDPDPTAGPDRAYWQRLRATAAPDPHNRTPLANKPGTPPLSVVALPDAPPQPWLAPRPGAPAGRTERHTAPGDRTVWMYTPPGAGHRDLPLVVLFDGDVWGGNGALGSTVDNLIAAGRIPPVAVLMVDPVDVPTRVRQMACDPSFVDSLDRHLIPWAAARWPLTADPARTVAAGQSLGGLTAAYCALRAPHRFGAVLSQSGSFWYPAGTPFEAGAGWLTGAWAVSDAQPRWYVEVGRREWELVGPTRHLRDVLRAKGHPLTYHEYDGGHDIACWRGTIADGLTALLGVDT